MEFIYFGDRSNLMEILHIIKGKIYEENENKIEEIMTESVFSERNIFMLKQIKNKKILEFANENNIFLLEFNPGIFNSIELNKKNLNMIFAKHFGVSNQNFQKNFYQNYLQFKILGFKSEIKSNNSNIDTIYFFRKKFYSLRDNSEKTHFLKYLLFKLENSFLKTGLIGLPSYYEIIENLII